MTPRSFIVLDRGDGFTYGGGDPLSNWKEVTCVDSTVRVDIRYSTSERLPFPSRATTLVQGLGEFLKELVPMILVNHVDGMVPTKETVIVTSMPIDPSGLDVDFDIIITAPETRNTGSPEDQRGWIQHHVRSFLTKDAHVLVLGDDEVLRIRVSLIVVKMCTGETGIHSGSIRRPMSAA